MLLNAAKRLALFLLIPFALWGQSVPTATLSGTVTDPNGNAYARAVYSVQLVDSAGTPTSSEFYQGQAVTPARFNGTLNNSGSFSLSVPLTSAMSPAGAQWKIDISAPDDPSILTYGAAWKISYTAAVTGNTDVTAALTAKAGVISYFDPRHGTSTFGSGSLGYVPLNRASNLSDLANPAAALTNLGALSNAGGNVGTTGWLGSGDGCLNAKSQVCGAKGDGVTDDSAALTACGQYAYAHNISCMRIPGGQYVLKSGVNWSQSAQFGGGLCVEGDGIGFSNGIMSGTVLLDELTEARPVLDMGGDSYGCLRHIKIWSQSAPTLSTAGFILNPGATGYDQACFGFQMEDDWIDNNPNGGVGTAAAFILGCDESIIRDVQFNGMGGAGLIWGQNPGTSTITSKFYTIPASSTNPTQAIMYNVSAAGNRDPAFEMTGAGEYRIYGGNFEVVGNNVPNPTSAMHVYSSGQSNHLIIEGARTENHSGNGAAMSSLQIDTSILGATISGNFCHGSGGGATISIFGADAARLDNGTIVDGCGDGVPIIQMGGSSGGAFRNNSVYLPYNFSSDSNVMSNGWNVIGNRFYIPNQSSNPVNVLAALTGLGNCAFSGSITTPFGCQPSAYSAVHGSSLYSLLDTTTGAPIAFPGYTVSTLPTCNTAAKGTHYIVSDATTPSYLGTLTGGGSVYAPVVCNGTAWVSY